MSPTSRSVHPDEASHTSVLHYFLEHAWPPAVDDPAVRPTLSVYGASYLFEINATYMIAARVVAPVLGWFASETAAARTFQVLLWFLLCVLALRNRHWALPLSVLLLSPQLWYVFSYFNSDAFSLFLGIVAALLLCNPKSSVRAYLAGERRISATAFLFALCLGLLLIGKANYLVLVPSLLLWLAVQYLDLRWHELLAILFGLALLGSSMFVGDVPALQFWHAKAIGAVSGAVLLLIAAASTSWRCLRDAELRVPMMRLLVILALAVAVAAPRVMQDILVNGMPASKSARMTAVQEEFAGAGFKPSEIAQGKGITNTALDIKGVNLGQMLWDPPYRWLQTNVMSSFGVYGYMAVVSPYAVYATLAGLLCAIVLIAAISLVRSHPAQGPRLLALSAGICCLVVLSSMLQSWVFDFQAQGRYLFPNFVILAMILGHTAPRLPSRLFKTFLFAALVVSAYSFVCIALPRFILAN